MIRCVFGLAVAFALFLCCAALFTLDFDFVVWNDDEEDQRRAPADGCPSLTQPNHLPSPVVSSSHESRIWIGSPRRFSFPGSADCGLCVSLWGGWFVQGWVGVALLPG